MRTKKANNVKQNILQVEQMNRRKHLQIYITCMHDNVSVPTPVSLGFPYGSADKESACDAGDLGLIPRLERSLGEWKGYPLQYSCLENPRDGGACHLWGCTELDTTEATKKQQLPIIQEPCGLVKNPPAMQETCVQSLSWEDPLENGKATHSSILAWKIPWTVQSVGSQRVRHDLATFTSFHVGFSGLERCMDGGRDLLTYITALTVWKMGHINLKRALCWAFTVVTLNTQLHHFTYTDTHRHTIAQDQRHTIFFP